VTGAVPAGTPSPTFAVAPYLREIGRGKDGARALDRGRARELMTAIVEGTISELALGAVLIALRMKGEATAEVAGFLDALEPHLERAAAAAPAWVVIPSYNGGRTAANLVPLLAMLLARAGLPVLVHGQASEPAAKARERVSSAEIFAALQVPSCATMGEARSRALAGLPAVVALQTFAPALARLVALRPVLGVRNVGHTLAKLVRPVAGASLLVTSYTHPDFGRLQAELFQASGMHAMTLRATDGEAVIGARRIHAIDHWRDGSCRTVVAGQSVAPAETGLPAPDAVSTAAWIREVLAGRTAAPAGLQTQVDAIAAALGRAPA
jgi:anthranilate phosphoribosyltransferase